MSLGGPPLKMRLKKSCKSAGLVGPVACSEGDLKGKSWKKLEPYSDFFFMSTASNSNYKDTGEEVIIYLKIDSK